MANLLLTATNWKDGTNTSPPAEWNGSAYVCAAADTITLTGTIAAGDKVAATITGVNNGYGHQIAVLVNGVDKLTGWAFPGDSFVPSFDIPLSPGDTVVIQLLNDTCGQFPDFTITPVPDPPAVIYDCSCDDATNNRTLAALRKDLLVRLGYAAQAANPPPGMVDLLNSFLIDAQEQLYRRYDVLRTERFFTWNMQKGVRFYDLPDNVETCTKKLDARKITWIGVEHNGVWYPLQPDIRPELYSFSQEGFPSRYEIRSCIEVWPAPSDDSFKLRIKGRFGLEPFAADTDKTTIDDRLVFLLALANAKAHYRHPDAGNYVQQLEVMMMRLVAGLHQTRRYIPGKRETYVDPDPIYIPLGSP